jgi:hypothetical protein
MRFLRPTVSYTLRDRKGNETVGEKLGVADIIEGIEKYRGQWKATWKRWKILEA